MENQSKVGTPEALDGSTSRMATKTEHDPSRNLVERLHNLVIVELAATSSFSVATGEARNLLHWRFENGACSRDCGLLRFPGAGLAISGDGSVR